MPFTKQEIENARKNSGDPNLTEANRMFTDIKNRVDQGRQINYYETFHFCDFLWMLSRKKAEGMNFLDYYICDDYFFLYAFKQYWGDLNGIYEHFEWTVGRKAITKTEIQQEVIKLDQISKTWNSIINTINHSEALLNLISKEARDEIKELDNQPEFNEYGFLNKNFNYQHKLKFILLRSKFVYLKVKELFDEMGVSTWSLNLGPRAIELDTYSMLHILSRHYPIGQKHVRLDKSDHDRSIHPNDIVSTLTQLFSLIPTGLIPKLDSNKIFFEFENRMYVIWIVPANKPAAAGGGHVQFERIGSFYPLEETAEVNRVKTAMNLSDLGSGFQIYSHPQLYT